MDLKNKVEEALESMRPFLKADGGDVMIEEISEDNVVRLRLLGACASCAMSIMTFKAGLEEAIMRAVPEVKSVEALNITDINDINATMPNSI